MRWIVRGDNSPIVASYFSPYSQHSPNQNSKSSLLKKAKDCSHLIKLKIKKSNSIECKKCNSADCYGCPFAKSSSISEKCSMSLDV